MQDELYANHLLSLSKRYDDALSKTGYSGVLLGAGLEADYFLDDQPIPYRSNPQLLQWLPLPAHPGTLLLYCPNRKPIVVIVQAEDYWRLPPALPGPPWDGELDVRRAADPRSALSALGTLPNQLALMGPESHWRCLGLQEHINPSAMLHALHYQRAVKTPYELAAIRAATRLSVAGHRAAVEKFRDRATEFEILMAFLAATKQTANELPYPAIVAGDTHAAVLHYQNYQRETPVAASLLIDAGCAKFGYAADITRCHAAKGHGEFAAMIEAMNTLQLSLCDEVRPGRAFGDLQELAHQKIANLLVDCDIIDASLEAILDNGASAVFFPHGLGHLLGLQVHDVGGNLGEKPGELLSPPARHPKLRFLRRLQAGQVLTIEPGLYFIDSLLRDLKAGPLAKAVNWDRVEALRPYGGIRIEDDVLVTEDGAENLTRAAFAAAR